jgi:ABC-2 type transport system ATP-binding protein
MTAPSPGSGIGPAAAAVQDWWGTEEICVRYGDKLALDHVTFHALPGQVSAVVGGDGAGRTTLLRCLAGAHAVSSGQVRLPAPLRIGYLSAGSGTYPDLSVDENLAFRASAYQMPAAAARERSSEFVERAGLAGARDRLAGQLSGGMRQKLGVIAAMLHQPDLLVLDEPTTGVDPVSRADLWWLIARAAADGAAVVLATSYLDEAERAVEILALDAGRVLATGTPQEIIAAMPGTLRVSDARPEGEDRRRAWRRGGRWRIWDPPGRSGPRITDLRHQNRDETDVIMTQIREKSGAVPEPERPDGDAAGGAGRAGSAVAPDLQDAVTVAILGRELAAAEPAGGQPEGDGSR